MSQRVSLSTSRASVDSTASELSDAPADARLGSNQSSVAYLVYANRGDPYSAGYKPPTTRDIPQIKLPRVEQPENAADYLEQARMISQVTGENATKDAGPGRNVSESSNGSVPDQTKSGNEDDGAADISRVPTLFSSEEFKLDNPRVFDEVIGDGDSTVIQEKLSWYIDIVEAQLEREVAASSTQFFAATAQFSEIETQASATSQKIAQFAQAAQKQREVVKYQMETAELQRKMTGVEQISHALDIMEELRKFVDTAEQQSSNYEALLNAQRFIAEQHSKGLDLSRVIAARPFLDKLDAVEVVMHRNVANQYATAMLTELRADFTTHAAEFSGLLNGDEARSALEAADNLGAREAACQLYVQEVEREVVRVVKSNMPNDRDGSPQPLARALHDLSPEEADKMLSTMFKQVTGLLAALKRQITRSNGVHDMSIVVDAVHNADNRIVRVLRVRKDPVTVLDTPQFVQFAGYVLSFCESARKLSDGQAEATELSEFLVAQTKLYIHTMHTDAEEQLIHAMDADDWRRIDVSRKSQLQVDLIAATSHSDPTSWEVTSSTTQNGTTSEQDTTTTQRVLLDSAAFLISRSTAQLVALLIPYLQLACVLPSHHIESVATALLELFRAYNNRLHHLILQFGATRTANLRHISVKNLVFAFECLRFVETLLGPIQQCFKRHHPPPNQLGVSFDAVQQLYFDHRSEIKRRLVKLMSDKASAYARQIGCTNWSLPTSGEPNKYMVDLMRQTTTVAHVAQEMMTADMSYQLVQEIYAVYKPKLLEAYSSVEVHTISEKQNVLRDLAYFKQKSESLKGAGNTADVVYESVNGFVAPDLPEITNTLTVSTPEAPTPRRSVEVPEADTSIAYIPEEETAGDSVKTQEIKNQDIEARGIETSEGKNHEEESKLVEKESRETEIREEVAEREAKEKEAREAEAREAEVKEIAEKEAAEKEAHEAEAREAEAREAEAREAEAREAEAREVEAREAKAREEEIKLAAEKEAAEKEAREAEAREAEAKEIAEKEAAEKEAHEAEAREAEAREAEAREAEAREAEAREVEAREAKAREEEIKLAVEKEAKEKEAREAEAREAEAKEIAEKEAAEKEAAEKEARETEARETEAREAKAREEEAKLAAEKEAAEKEAREAKAQEEEAKLTAEREAAEKEVTEKEAREAEAREEQAKLAAEKEKESREAEVNLTAEKTANESSEGGASAKTPKEKAEKTSSAATPNGTSMDSVKVTDKLAETLDSEQPTKQIEALKIESASGVSSSQLDDPALESTETANSTEALGSKSKKSNKKKKKNKRK